MHHPTWGARKEPWHSNQTQRLHTQAVIRKMTHGACRVRWWMKENTVFTPFLGSAECPLSSAACLSLCSPGNCWDLQRRIEFNGGNFALPSIPLHVVKTISQMGSQKHYNSQMSSSHLAVFWRKSSPRLNSLLEFPFIYLVWSLVWKAILDNRLGSICMVPGTLLLTTQLHE